MPSQLGIPQLPLKRKIFLMPRFCIPGNLQLSLIRFLLLGSLLPSILPSRAQTYSPAPAVDGNAVTINVPVSSQVLDVGISIVGPAPANSINVGVNIYPVNGVASFKTPPLPAGNYQVTVFYSGNFPGQVICYPLTVFSTGAGDAPALQGQYTFQLSGQAANIPSGAKAVAAAGSFTADGQGNITAGIMDLNSPAGLLAGVAVTGTYQLNAYGSGTLNLVYSQGTLQLNLQATPLFSATLQSFPFPQAPLVLNNGVLSTNAGGLASANGTLQQIGSTATASTILPRLGSGFFASLTGELPYSTTAFSAATQFRFNPDGTLTSDGTVAGNGTSYDYAGLAGTYTPFDAITGRSVLTLINPAQPSAQERFAVYQLRGGTTLYLISTTPEYTGGLVAGRADQY